MKAYAVSWGPVSVAVFAANENEAWAKFCDSHDLARRHPELYQRKFETYKPVDSSSVKPKPVVAEPKPAVAAATK